jgi:arabinofuranosyltransferase
VRGAVGYVGFHLGPTFHVLDYHGLGDPLLSRLPITRPDPVLAKRIPRLGAREWRIGHFYRRPPPGYIRTLATDRNEIEDEALASYYAQIRSIVRDPVFDRERLETLWRFQTGAYDALLATALEKR